MSVRFLECESISDTFSQIWHKTVDQVRSLSFRWGGLVSRITVFFDGPPIQAEHLGDRIQTHPLAVHALNPLDLRHLFGILLLLSRHRGTSFRLDGQSLGPIPFVRGSPVGDHPLRGESVLQGNVSQG